MTTDPTAGQWVSPRGTSREETPLTDLPSRDVDRLETAIRDLTGALDKHRVEMASTYVRKDVYERDIADIKGDVKGHSEIFTWLGRIVIGAVALALLALVLNQTGGVR